MILKSLGFFWEGGVCNERNIKLRSDIIFAVVLESHWSLHIAPITFYVLAVFWEDDDWGKNSLSLSDLLGLSAQSKASEAGTLTLQMLCFVFYLHHPRLIN